MEEHKRQLAMACQGSQAHVSGGGSGGSSEVGWWTGQTVALMAAVVVSGAIIGGLAGWLLRRASAHDDYEDDEYEEEEEIDVDAVLPTLEEVWAKCPDALVREYGPVLESLRPGTHPEVIAKGLQTLESMIDPSVQRVDVWIALLRLFLSLEPPTTGRPDEPTPLLDRVSTLLGRMIVILRFENLGPSLELALRHARTIFASSDADKEVCVRLLNELSIAPQSLSLSDASAKATLKVFARTIAETPLPASDKQLSEIHWHAIAGLNKFITMRQDGRIGMVAVTIIIEAQCFERLVSLLEHDVLQESARHQQVRQAVTDLQAILLRLCVTSIEISEPQREERVNQCLQRLCSTTVAEFLVNSLHDVQELEKLHIMLWLALTLFLRAGHKATSITKGFQSVFIKRSDSAQRQGGASLFDFLLSIVANHTHWAPVPQLISDTLTLTLLIVSDYGVAREQARASDKFMSAVRTLAELRTTDTATDPGVLAQKVLAVLEPPSWETQEETS